MWGIVRWIRHEVLQYCILTKYRHNTILYKVTATEMRLSEGTVIDDTCRILQQAFDIDRAAFRKSSPPPNL